MQGNRRDRLVSALMVPPTTKADAVAWLSTALEFMAGGFHPDTDAADYVDFQTGKPTFSKAEAAKFEKSLGAVFELIPDPYSVCVSLMKARKAEGEATRKKEAQSKTYRVRVSWLSSKVYLVRAASKAAARRAYDEASPEDLIEDEDSYWESDESVSEVYLEPKA